MNILRDGHMADISTITLIGPEYHGRRMSLEEFARAEGQPGHLYELERGTVVVVNIPDPPHGRVVRVIFSALDEYDKAHPGRINFIGMGNQAAMQMPDLQSERHPDVSVYFSIPPVTESKPWEFWTPDIAIEVVSPGSTDRDYHIKREEYLRAGVRLYWIIDPLERSATALLRRNDTWQEQRIPESGKLTTRWLPGFELTLGTVFAAYRWT
jgi:Uma2 family endonuclease